MNNLHTLVKEKDASIARRQGLRHRSKCNHEWGKRQTGSGSDHPAVLDHIWSLESIIVRQEVVYV